MPVIGLESIRYELCNERLFNILYVPWYCYGLPSSNAVTPFLTADQSPIPGKYLHCADAREMFLDFKPIRDTTSEELPSIPTMVPVARMEPRIRMQRAT